ncbi:MAG: hypothetical protein ACRDEA_17100, partial [Microcystaceae cyanobacterium]
MERTNVTTRGRACEAVTKCVRRESCDFCIPVDALSPPETASLINVTNIRFVSQINQEGWL